MKVEIDHPHGTIIVSLEEWIRIGPGPRPLLQPKRCLNDQGEPLPLNTLPLKFRNTVLSRLMIKFGLLEDPWPEVDQD